MTGLEYAAPCAVAGRAVLSIPGQGMVPSRAIHLGELVTEAAAAGCRVVLVHGEALAWWGMPALLEGKMTTDKAQAERAEKLAMHPFVQGAVAAGCDMRHEGGWRTRLKVPGASFWSSVVWLPYETSSRAVSGPWRGAATYSELVLALSRFGHTAGFGWQDSVGRTAERLILATHPPDKGGTLLERHPSLPDPWKRGGSLEGPIKWRRPLEAWEHQAKFVHGFDANAQYLAAWGVAELGRGDPVQPAAFTLDKPGVWKLDPKWVGWAAIDEPTLPGPVWPQESEWLTSPTVRRVLELAAMAGVDPPAVRDGWIWPEQTRYLRGAADRLRDARTELLADTGPAAALARDAIKSIYKVETGRFNMSRRDEISGWHRPDWGDMIRAIARANLHRRIAGTLDGPKQTGRPALLCPPFAVDVDALYIAGDTADPVQFAGEIGIPIGDALGQFKVLGSCSLTDVRAKELDDAASLPAMKKAWAQMIDEDRAA